MTAGGPNAGAGGPNFSSDDSQGRADAALARLAGACSLTRLFVPGRIEVLGKHTDYAGGHSVTCAAERGFSVSYVPRDDDRVRLVDACDGRQVDFRIDAGLTPEIGHWSSYPMTVARRLAHNFGPLDRGVDIAFFGTLPKSAGLSTSSALMTAVFLVLADVNHLRADARFHDVLPDSAALAGYLGSIENGRDFGPFAGDAGVGTSGGSEDHTAIVMSEAGMLGWYRYHPVERLRQMPLREDLSFVIAASGIAAAKTGDARERYNRASDLVSELVAIGTALRTDRRAELQFRRHGDALTLADLLDSAPEAAAELRAGLAGCVSRFPVVDLQRRLDHFITEDRQILPAAFGALGQGRLSDFGALVDRSQRAARDLLGNQVPETVTLARLARELGAHAASSFGAGFGGSVWALVDANRAEAFAEQWMSAYAGPHPDAAARATAFVTQPGSGVAGIAVCGLRNAD